MQDIKTAIIPIAGMATRFLPLSKIVPKEFWPLVDQPMIYYALNELKNNSITNVVFILGENKQITEYFKPDPALEKILKERKKQNILNELKKLEDFAKDFNFTFVCQKKPLGDGHAILQAAKAAGQEPVVCIFPDDIIESKVSCVEQLLKIFKTCQKPIMGLSRTPREKIPWYGIAKVEKIANRLYKLKGIVEKPTIESAPSDLANCTKLVLTPEVFEYLKTAKPNQKGEIILAEVLDAMIRDGKLVYGYEVEGKWLECGNKQEWIKSFVYLSLKHPQFGPELRTFIKELKI